MVMTILEARVLPENWTALERAYSQAIEQDEPGLAQTFLIHSKKEGDLWQILTVWRSQEALDAMRKSGQTPRGVLIFREAKAEPVLSVFEIKQQLTRDNRLSIH